MQANLDNYSKKIDVHIALIEKLKIKLQKSYEKKEKVNNNPNPTFRKVTMEFIDAQIIAWEKQCAMEDAYRIHDEETLQKAKCIFVERTREIEKQIREIKAKYN